MKNLDDIDRAVLALAQGDLPLSEKPFKKWADQLGMGEDELLARIDSLKKRGVIRDFKAIMRHARAGVTANAMVAWEVRPGTEQTSGEAIAGFDEVSHCYERPAFGRYTIFSMIHGATREDVLGIVKRIAELPDVLDYSIFWSERELKKSSMKYF